MSHPSLQDRVIRLDCAVHHGGARVGPPRMLILHSTRDKNPARSTILYLNTTPEKKASYNYVIDRDGAILRMTDQIAWHAGDSGWPDPVVGDGTEECRPNGGKSVNGISVGICWAHQDGETLTDEQLESADWLCSLFMDMHHIPLELVRGHYEVSPGRKTDPRAAIDMEEFRALLEKYRRDA